MTDSYKAAHTLGFFQETNHLMAIILIYIFQYIFDFNFNGEFYMTALNIYIPVI